VGTAQSQSGRPLSALRYAHLQVGFIKVWEKCVKSSVSKESEGLNMFLPFYALNDGHTHKKKNSLCGTKICTIGPKVL
jgi:hypothetical protein